MPVRKKSAKRVLAGKRARHRGGVGERKAIKICEQVFGGIWVRTSKGYRQQVGDIQPDDYEQSVSDYYFECKKAHSFNCGQISKWWSDTKLKATKSGKHKVGLFLFMDRFPPVFIYSIPTRRDGLKLAPVLAKSGVIPCTEVYKLEWPKPKRR